MKLKGAKSKQIKLGTKRKREKKVRDGKRKLKKEAKKAKQNGTYQKRLKKDPGIPNLWPFKHEMLQGLQRKKAGEKYERLEKKLARERARKNTDTVVKDYSAMQRQAQRKQKQFADDEEEEEDEEAGQLNAGKKAFMRDLRKVVEQADVIIEVLDARDPNSCRCKTLEAEIAAKGKKVVLLLNKIDLVPVEATKAWLTSLRNHHPTVAFKAARTSSSGGADRAVHAKVKAENASAGLLNSAFGVVGADTLLQLLKNYSRISQDKKKALIVGIVGYPNVGKSSVINSLKRTAAVKVGGVAGVTRSLQSIQLDSKLTLIDSPGVVFAGNSSDPSVVLRNATNVEQLSDPCGVVDALLMRAPRDAILRHFVVPAFDTTMSFLTMVAKARGKLKKGGAANQEAGAKFVLNEWTSGKLRYFTMPPAQKNTAGKKQIVAAWRKELDVDALFAKEDQALAECAGAAGLEMQAGDFGADPVEDESEEDDEMDEDDEEDEDMDEDDEDDEDEDDEEGGQVQIDAPYDFKTDIHLKAGKRR